MGTQSVHISSSFKNKRKLRACYTAEFIQRCLLLEREWQVVASLQSMAALMFLFGDYDDDDDGDGECDCEGGDAESGYGEHGDDRMVVMVMVMAMMIVMIVMMMMIVKNTPAHVHELYSC